MYVRIFDGLPQSQPAPLLSCQQYSVAKQIEYFVRRQISHPLVEHPADVTPAADYGGSLLCSKLTCLWREGIAVPNKERIRDRTVNLVGRYVLLYPRTFANHIGACRL